MTVAALLQHKGSEVASVRPDDTIGTVVRVLTERSIGAVVVLDAAGQPVGIVSERDIVHALAAKGMATQAVTAGELMTRTLKTATPNTTVSEAMGMMTFGRFRHLPVIDNGVLVGLVSIGDVVRAKLRQQEAEMEGLRAHVAGAAYVSGAD
jgi:CBS domain-containing protein